MTFSYEVMGEKEPGMRTKTSILADDMVTYSTCDLRRVINQKRLEEAG